MIRIRSVLLFIITFTVCLQTFPAQSATYYISPTGSDANPGTSEKPWLTFAYALNEHRVWCGDSLVLLDGTYGNATNTGRIDINGVTCTAGNELTVRALNQRKAKIVTGGSGKAIWIRNSAFIIVDGLYGRAADDSSSTKSGEGQPISVNTSNHVTVRNSLFRNPNRYSNTAAFSVLYSKDILSEDNEVYVFHRHCHSAGEAQRVTVRRLYCNPRDGALPDGVGAQWGTNRADSLFSFYPCKDCTLENSIADGTTGRLYLAEMNATYGGGILMSGGKVLGSICYKCNYANGIYPAARKADDLNHSPQNITIRDVAFVDHNSPSAMIRCSDCVNATIDHITGLGIAGGVAGMGIVADDSLHGVDPSLHSATITNSVVANVVGFAFRITSVPTWSGNKLIANNVGAAFSPSPPSNWTNTSTAAHGLGTCKVWVPDGSPLKGAASDGGDIGATILYRYVDGVLTNIPLWDPVTGEFPHGATDLDGTNAIVGESLFDFHTRINVNRGGCPFPKHYGSGNSDAKPPTSPAGLTAF